MSVYTLGALLFIVTDFWSNVKGKHFKVSYFQFHHFSFSGLWRGTVRMMS